MTAGAEKFLEERRSLQTCPVTRSPNSLRMLGSATLIVGLASALGWGHWRPLCCRVRTGSFYGRNAESWRSRRPPQRRQFSL